jgi:hypothetical protein
MRTLADNLTWTPARRAGAAGVREGIIDAVDVPCVP